MRRAYFKQDYITMLIVIDLLKIPVVSTKDLSASSGGDEPYVLTCWPSSLMLSI